MTSRTTSTRQYSLRRVKKDRCTDKPTFIVRLDDDVTRQGCVIKKLEGELRLRFPHFGIQRSGETLRITSKKRALYLVLDTIVADAIEQMHIVHGERHLDKARQDRRPERQLKQTARTLQHRTPERAHALAGRITGSSPGWLQSTPLELATELAEGLKLPAAV